MNDQAKSEAIAGDADRPQIFGGRGNGYVLLGILALLTLGFLYLARDILLPIAIAFLFSIVLGPVVRWLARRRVPAPLSASAIVVILLMGFTSMGYLLLGPVAAIVADAPRIGNEIQEKFSVLRRPVAAIGRATAQIESIVSPDDGTEKIVVDSGGGALIGNIATDAGQRLAAMGLSLVLLFFILASGDLFQEKLIKILPTLLIHGRLNKYRSRSRGRTCLLAVGDAEPYPVGDFHHPGQLYPVHRRWYRRPDQLWHCGCVLRHPRPNTPTAFRIPHFYGPRRSSHHTDDRRPEACIECGRNSPLNCLLGVDLGNHRRLDCCPAAGHGQGFCRSR